MDEKGNRIKGGFRNFGKVRTYWSKCYKSSQKQNEPKKVEPMTKKFRQLDYKIWGANRVSLSDQMEKEIKDRFQFDRENRFQLFLLSSGLRNKYLDKKTKKYTKEFEKWYKEKGMNDLYGSLSNFTKYCSCGDVISYVGTKTNDPQKYLKQLPLSVGSLYELSMVLKDNRDVFNILLHYTPKRKSVDDPKYEWIT